MDIPEEEAVTLPAGTKLKSTRTGKIYVTEESVVLNDETEIIRVKCTETGEDGDLNTGEILEFVDPIESVDKFTTVESVTAYGTDGINGTGNKSVSEQLQIQSDLNMQNQSISDNLQPLVTADKKTFADWLTTVKEVKDKAANLYKKASKTAGDIESVYAKALNIARGTLRIMQFPSRVAVSLSEKIKGYSKMTAQLINQYKNDPFGIKNIANAYATARLALTGAVASIASGSALSIAGVAASSGRDISAGTASREEAIETANTIMELLETVREFSDSKIAQNAFVDADSGAYLVLVELVQASVELIMNASFALPMQRTITLDRDRQVVELCAELYGGVDDYLDQFIMENNFNIDEIQLIPMGRKVSYYVQSA